MLNRKNLEDEILAPTLQALGMDSPAARALILGTIAQESAFGTHVRQIGGGPALGICQMEPATFRDILGNWLAYRRHIQERMRKIWPALPGPEALVEDHRLAVAMCRLHYARVSEPLPAADDIEGLARYWKQYYNTPRGAGTVEEFVENFHHYLGAEV